MPKSPQPLATLLTVSFADKKQLAVFQEKTAEQLAAIEVTETLNVKRRLYVGLALHCIKTSLAHGEFTPWLKKHAQGAGQRQCNYMMKAALVFLGASGLAAPELKALPLGDSQLAVNDTIGKRIDAKAEKFIAGMSWGELLAEHDIKDAAKLGGARGKAGKGKAAHDPEQLYLFARDEIGLTLQRAEELFFKENRLQHLVGHPEEVRGVVESLRTLADKVEKAAKPLLKK